MREVRVRSVIDGGGQAAAGWLAIPSAFAAETMAHAGWDALIVDMQHGVIDYADAVAMLTAISTTDATPMVRVPWLDPGLCMKMLDAGAMGLICPMIETADQARALVEACRYPPLGGRSFGPARARLYAGADYGERANDTVLVLAMIETARGVENLEAILAVDGLDGIYVGPNDLSISLGGPAGVDHADGPAADAVRTIGAACRRAGRIAGLFCGSPAHARRMAADGYALVNIGYDAGFLEAGSIAAIAAFRSQ
jgi:4-hydroxy-2-oxoheptanedioate aldolase